MVIYWNNNNMPAPLPRNKNGFTMPLELRLRGMETVKSFVRLHGDEYIKQFLQVGIILLFYEKFPQLKPFLIVIIQIQLYNRLMRILLIPRFEQQTISSA
jgi:hypothetical protein